MRSSTILLPAAMWLFAGSIAAQPAAAPAPIAGEPVAPALAQTVAHMIAGLLEANYINPAIGSRYAAALRARPAERGPTDGIALARALTAELQAVAPDGHLRVLPPGQAVPMMRRPDAGRPTSTPGAVEAARWIAPGIAYIRLASMVGDPATTAAVERFMQAHVEAETIIIDARANLGGGSGPADVILPYLYAKPTVLVHMDMRAGPDAAGYAPFADGPLIRRIAAPAGIVRRERSIHPHPRERRLVDARVFYLTSNRTASAAETMALALKRTRRGTVVGEATRGAGHFGRIYPLPGGFNLFLPFGRTFDPDTGGGFEGTGVAPDVVVPAEAALGEALRRAGVVDEMVRTRALAAAAPAD